METINKPGPWSTSLKWGIIGGVVLIIISYLGSMNIDWSSYESIEGSRKSPLQYLTYLLLAIFIIVAQLEHRKKDLGGYMSYGRAVGVATITSIGVGICTAIYMYVLFGIFHPEFQQMIIDAALDKAEDMSPGEEDQMIKIMKMTTGPGAMALFGFFGQVFIGLVIGLISSIFIQKTEQ